MVALSDRFFALTRGRDCPLDGGFHEILRKSGRPAFATDRIIMRLPSLDLFLRRLRDPRWIPNISDYCDDRCERCAFTERCWSYAVRQRAEAGLSLEEEPEEREEENQTMKRTEKTEGGRPRVQGWAERHGIDLNDDTMDAAETKPTNNAKERIHNDPLRKRVHDYGRDIWEVMRPLVPLERGGGFGRAAPGSALSNAVEDVWGLALTISVKTSRAISSFEYNKEEDIETDPVQTDANGSAKVARLAIAQSLAAWKIVEPAGIIDPGLAEYLAGPCSGSSWNLSRTLSARHGVRAAGLR